MYIEQAYKGDIGLWRYLGIFGVFVAWQFVGDTLNCTLILK